MPRWTPHSKSLAALSRRWRLNVQPSEMLTGVLPTAQIDKSWTSDRLDVFGMLVQHTKDNVQTAIPAVGLRAGSRDCLVHRIDWWISAPPYLVEFQGLGVHLFTPNSAYNPFALSPGVYFPWLQSRQRVDQIVTLTDSIGIGGEALAHQTIVVNGTPVVTFGPAQRGAYGVAGTIQFAHQMTDSTFWEFQDPPLRIKPWQNLVVQFTGSFTTVYAGMILNANFYWSEQDPQGDTG